MPQRTGGVGEPERLQPPPGRVRGQSQVVTGYPGHGFQQRPVEQFGVQSPYLRGNREPVGAEQLDGVAPPAGPVAQRVRQPPLPGRIRRYQMGAAQLLQLEPVLDGAQEPVRTRQ